VFGLTALKNAIGTLTANVLGLAGTVAEINGNLRQRAALDSPEPADQPAPAAFLPLDGKAAGVPQDATVATDTPATDQSASSPSRNGRRNRVAGAAT
jgi:hypothetical protein